MEYFETLRFYINFILLSSVIALFWFGSQYSRSPILRTMVLGKGYTQD